MNELRVWSKEAWLDYIYWQSQDKQMLRRINKLLHAIARQPYTGIGRPEALTQDLEGFWSRRIDDTHRLVYAIDGSRLSVISCRYRY
jgi:toxin YoeB